MDSFNLDNFEVNVENIENVDLELDNLDLNAYEVDEVKFPHIMVTTKQFKELLKIAKTVIANGAKDIISKSLCLKAENGKLIAYCTDFDVYLEYSLDLLNVDNVLEDSIAFPVDMMVKLMKAVPSKVVIYKDEEGFKLQLVGGSIPLEIHNIDSTKYLFADEIVESKVPTMQATILSDIMRDFTPIVTNAITPGERRIVFSENGAVGMYMFSMIKSRGEYPSMDIKARDMSTLKQLVTNKDENLLFYDVKDTSKSKRKIIKGSNFSYAFLISDLAPNKMLIEMESELDTQNGMFVDFLQIYKLVELSSELNYSLGKLGLAYTDESKVKLLLKTKKGKDSEFLIDGTMDGMINPSTPVEMQSKFFKVLLSSFNKESSIKLCVTPKAVAIITDSYHGVLFVEK